MRHCIKCGANMVEQENHCSECKKKIIRDYHSVYVITRKMMETKGIDPEEAVVTIGKRVKYTKVAILADMVYFIMHNFDIVNSNFNVYSISALTNEEIDNLIYDCANNMINTVCEDYVYGCTLHMHDFHRKYNWGIKDREFINVTNNIADRFSLDCIGRDYEDDENYDESGDGII
jgi:hypothetical protein